MPDDAFQNWRHELEAVEQEMDRLMTAGLPASTEERQVRRTRFAALIERRESAARNLLRSDGTRHRKNSPRDRSRSDDHLPSAAHAGAGATREQASVDPAPDEKSKAGAQFALSAYGTSAAVPDCEVPAATPPAAEHATEVAALAPDAMALAPNFAAIPAAGLPVDAAGHRTEVVVSAAWQPSDPVGNLPGSALASDAKAQSALSSDDLHGAVLQLLRRLQSEIGKRG
jgi:hypothetical protein